MKLHGKRAWLIALVIGCITSTVAQEAIWSENFNTQTDGLDNGNYGPIISANGKWNLAVINQGGDWLGGSDYIKVNNDLIEGRDTDNRCEWSSVAIDVSAHSDVTISIDMSETGNHELTDTLAAYYILDGGALTEFDTNGINVDDFTSVTASTSLPTGNTLQVFVHLKNNSSTEYLMFDNVVVSGIPDGEITLDPEPTNHVSGIDFTSITSTGFTVNWIDTNGGNLPSGYLVKISEGIIASPIDQITENDGAMIINVVQGAQTASFASLMVNTSYNVAIYPYSNSGTDIDYKLSPENNQITTADIPEGSLVFISELADPNNSSNGRYIELYNNSASNIDLSGWKLQRYTNATPTASSPLNLSGTIEAYSTFVIGKSTFSSIYGFEPDMTSMSNVVDSNGDDNIELLNASDVRADIFGVPGEDGSNTNHEFEDGRAERNIDVNFGNIIYTPSEWTIDNDSGGGNGAIDAPEGFDPGIWIGELTELTVTTNTNENNYQLASNETLTVSDGAVLTISNGGQLEGSVKIEPGSGIEITSGTLDNLSDITLEDGAYIYENGGFFNNTGTFKLKRMTTVDASAFNFLSSPVSSASLQTVLSGSNVITYNPTSFVGDGMGNTNNTTAWVYHTTGNLDVGQGYAVSGSQSDNSGIRTFSGSPNSGNYVLEMLTSNNGNPNGESWNLAGNPYPSPIEIGAFLTTNSAVIENGVYLWDDTVDDYVTKNIGMHASELIAVGQGFFVQAKADANVNYTNSMRRGSSASFYRWTQAFVMDIVLENKTGKKNYTTIALAENAKDDKDELYDSQKMFGNENLSIYTLLNNDAYALQGFSNQNIQQIPLGVRAAKAGKFWLKIVGNDIDEIFTVTLQDKLLNTSHVVDENGLEIFLEEGVTDNRFMLHIRDAKKASVTNKAYKISYKLMNGILSVADEDHSIKEIKLRDLSGHLIHSFGGNTIDINFLASGVYILEVRRQSESYYEKLIF